MFGLLQHEEGERCETFLYGRQPLDRSTIGPLALPSVVMRTEFQASPTVIDNHVCRHLCFSRLPFDDVYNPLFTVSPWYVCLPCRVISCLISETLALISSKTDRSRSTQVSWRHRDHVHRTNISYHHGSSMHESSKESNPT